MELEYRQRVIGVIAGLAAFAAYWVIVLTRAATDDASFTHVAWQGPLLLTVGVGGAIYGAAYGFARLRTRGEMVSDARDKEIERAALATGSGLTSLAVLAALILLGLGVGSFWVAHVLFVGAFLGSLAESGTAIAAYREGLQP